MRNYRKTPEIGRMPKHLKIIVGPPNSHCRTIDRRQRPPATARRSPPRGTTLHVTSIVKIDGRRLSDMALTFANRHDTYRAVPALHITVVDKVGATDTSHHRDGSTATQPPTSRSNRFLISKSTNFPNVLIFKFMLTKSHFSLKKLRFFLYLGKNSENDQFRKN